MDKNILNSISKDFDENGFVFFRNFFPPDIIEKANKEIEDYFLNHKSNHNEGGGSKFMEWKNPSQQKILDVMIDVYGKCPTLDHLVGQFLEDSTSSEFIKLVAGNIKLRGYNIQRFTGIIDPRPTIGPAPMNHEWHRDAPGEMNIGILLTDCPGPDNGASALIKGSQRFPYCPRKNCLLGQIMYYYDTSLNFFLKFNLFNRILARRILKNVTGAYGKKGDVYIFTNDVWHGREANLYGAKVMRMMIGFFPNDIPFPDKVKELPQEVLKQLPRSLQKVLLPQPINEFKNTLMHKILNGQKEPAFFSLFYLARMERKIANLLLRTYNYIHSLIAKISNKIKLNY